MEGNWITGTPLSCDGYGAILESEEGQFLVRVEAISAVAYVPAPVSVPQARVHPAAYESGLRADLRVRLRGLTRRTSQPTFSTDGTWDIWSKVNR